MIILGIETSCDETAASLVENGSIVLSSVIASSSEMHKQTGGIVPEQAARQQLKSIVPVIDKAISQSRKKITDIDAIAVTCGPGLIGSLLVGVESAKTLSLVLNKPIIPVNHLVGHVYANFIADDKLKLPEFPLLALVVSGGHTDLVLLKDHPSKRKGNLKWIGGTRDDAAGEAFDKAARLLGLPYPGGPSISEHARYVNSDKRDVVIKLPRPLIHDEGFDWSFSGLKTAVLKEYLKLKKEKHLNKKNINLLAFEVQEAICDVLVDKSIRAIIKYKPRSFLLAGGVAANNRLREKFQNDILNVPAQPDLFIPYPTLCTDNAVYIASCAYFNYKPSSWEHIEVNPELTITGQV